MFIHPLILLAVIWRTCLIFIHPFTSSCLYLLSHYPAYYSPLGDLRPMSPPSKPQQKQHTSHPHRANVHNTLPPPKQPHILRSFSQYGTLPFRLSPMPTYPSLPLVYSKGIFNMSTSKPHTAKSKRHQPTAKTNTPQELPVHISEVAAQLSARLLAQNDDPIHRLPPPNRLKLSPAASLYYYIIARLSP
jgi:hypothetical protein